MKIIVGTDLAHYCARPGAVDNRMAFVLGLRQLGHDVFLFVDVDPHRCLGPDYKPIPFEQWRGAADFEALARAYDVWPDCCLIYDSGRATRGMSLRDGLALAAKTDLFVNIAGQFKTASVLERVRHRAYVDEAPPKPQVYHAEYGIDQGFDRHEHFFSVGLNVGRSDSPVPTSGRTWHGMVHPVVLDHWPARIDDGFDRFTTISNWAGKETFHLQGRYSGEKSDNWWKFIDLPRKTTQKLELAMNFGAGYEADAKTWADHGWLLFDPTRLRTLEDYRRYVGSSRAEFSVANQRYVEFRTGWTSDRTARYLASGKPVLVQSTGFEDQLPTGRGLLTFNTPDEALAGIEAVNRDYLGHCRAARQIAEEHFDARKVLSKMLKQMELC